MNFKMFNTNFTYSAYDAYTNIRVYTRLEQNREEIGQRGRYEETEEKRITEVQMKLYTHTHTFI